MMWPAVPAGMQLPVVPAGMQLPAVPAGTQLPAVPAGTLLPAVPAGKQLPVDGVQLPAEAQVPAVPAGVQVPAGLRHVHTVFGQGLLAASLGREPLRAGSTEYPATFYPLRGTGSSKSLPEASACLSRQEVPNCLYCIMSWLLAAVKISAHAAPGKAFGHEW